MTQSSKTALFAYVLLIPALAYILFIQGYPLIETFRLSFTDASLSPTTNWVGFANYEKIFGGKFIDVIIRTFHWMLVSVSLKILLGTFGAVLLNAAVPGRSIFRVLVMPSWIIPIAIGVFMWGWMYNGQFGMISGLLQRFDLIDQPLEFIAYRNTAFYATIVTDVWIGTPLVTIYLLAAMQSIPKDLYEAAWTDGAGRWYRFRRITMPLIMPAILTMSLLSAIWTFNSFDIIWILTGGGPRGATTTMIIDTYKVAISRYQYGQGAARAVMICIFLSMFALIYYRFITYMAKRSGGIK
ncbi:MAG: ABC transporter permease [Hyphomicrobiales bacterium]|nr:MAG: ABC transporter permease [Hyphomicrobiales bacterium]